MGSGSLKNTDTTINWNEPCVRGGRGPRLIKGEEQVCGHENRKLKVG